MIHWMVNRSKEDLDPPFSPLVVCDHFFSERLGNQRVTPIIRPGKLELEVDVMGGSFTSMSQSKRSSGTSIIATPLLV